MLAARKRGSQEQRDKDCSISSCLNHHHSYTNINRHLRQIPINVANSNTSTAEKNHNKFQKMASKSMTSKSRIGRSIKKELSSNKSSSFLSSAREKSRSRSSSRSRKADSQSSTLRPVQTSNFDEHSHLLCSEDGHDAPSDEIRNIKQMKEIEVECFNTLIF